MSASIIDRSPTSIDADSWQRMAVAERSSQPANASCEAEKGDENEGSLKQELVIAYVDVWS